MELSSRLLINSFHGRRSFRIHISYELVVVNAQMIVWLLLQKYHRIQRGHWVSFWIVMSYKSLPKFFLRLVCYISLLTYRLIVYFWHGNSLEFPCQKYTIRLNAHSSSACKDYSISLSLSYCRYSNHYQNWELILIPRSMENQTKRNIFSSVFFRDSEALFQSYE